MGRLLAVALSILAAANGCKGESAGGGDSETHFLGSCDGGGCAAGLECICGVCTKPCDESAACAGLAASAECSNSCGETSTKTCDVLCGADGECAALGSGFACDAGRCRVRTSSGSAGSGGGGGPATSACLGEPAAVGYELSPIEFVPDEMALAIAVVGSCNPDDGIDRNASHLWTGDLDLPAIYLRAGLQSRCLAESRCGCAAVEHCLGRGVEPIETCTPGCDGGVWSVCAEFDLPEGYGYHVDCGKVGMTCDPDAGCVEQAAVACDEASFVPSCTAEGRGEHCQDGFLRYTPVCADVGLSCVQGQCVGGGAACTNELSAQDGEIAIDGLSCTGSVLEACVNGRLGSIDCTTRGPGFGCQELDGAFFCGLAAECVPGSRYRPSPTHPASCDGATLVFCNAGRLEHVDCLALGFTGCEVDRSNARYGCIPGFEL